MSLILDDMVISVKAKRTYKKLLKLIAIYSKDTEYEADTQNITIYKLR